MNGIKIRYKRQRQSERKQQIEATEGRLLRGAKLGSRKAHEVTAPPKGTRFIRLRTMPSTPAPSRSARRAYVCP
jgi:hypothetical protein